MPRARMCVLGQQLLQHDKGGGAPSGRMGVACVRTMPKKRVSRVSRNSFSSRIKRRVRMSFKDVSLSPPASVWVGGQGQRSPATKTTTAKGDDGLQAMEHAFHGCTRRN
jgi:hypothetical protein